MLKFSKNFIYDFRKEDVHVGYMFQNIGPSHKHTGVGLKAIDTRFTGDLMSNVHHMMLSN